MALVLTASRVQAQASRAVLSQLAPQQAFSPLSPFSELTLRYPILSNFLNPGQPPDLYTFHLPEIDFKNLHIPEAPTGQVSEVEVAHMLGQGWSSPRNPFTSALRPHSWSLCDLILLAPSVCTPQPPASPRHTAVCALPVVTAGKEAPSPVMWIILARSFREGVPTV